jgi:phosphate uptake regulator
MRRSIIKQGNRSYTLTLPIDWIREESLLEGGEVEIEEEERKLVIGVPEDKRKSESKIEADLDGYSIRTIKNILNASYRKGYDTILLQFKDKKTLPAIKDIVRKTLLGFEVTEEKENSCIIQNIAEPSNEKFEVMLRKIFLSIMQDSKDITESINVGKWNIKRFDESKNLVDNYTNFCRRLVIKNKLGGSKDSYFLHSIVTRLSLIYHSYFYMYEYLNTKKAKLSKEAMELLEKTNNMFESFYEAFYKKDIEKIDEIELLREKLISSVYKLLEKKKGAENVAIYHMGEIIRLIHLTSINIINISDIYKNPGK